MSIASLEARLRRVEQHRSAGRVRFVWAGNDEAETAAEIERLVAEHPGERVMTVRWLGTG
jgi:hypothetical protein